MHNHCKERISLDIGMTIITPEEEEQSPLKDLFPLQNDLMSSRKGEGSRNFNERVGSIAEILVT
jgi:hypothetical protein